MNYVESFNLFGTEAMQIPCIKGQQAPDTSTPGAVGCLYLDTVSKSKDLYKCTAVSEGSYTWEILNGTGGTGGIEPLLVNTVDDDGNPVTVTPAEILAHISKGGPVYYDDVSTYTALSFCSEALAEFITIVNGQVGKYVVDADGAQSFVSTNFVTQDEIGDISTALDSIIAIQNGLIGGDEA